MGFNDTLEMAGFRKNLQYCFDCMCGKAAYFLPSKHTEDDEMALFRKMVMPLS